MKAEMEYHDALYGGGYMHMYIIIYHIEASPYMCLRKICFA